MDGRTYFCEDCLEGNYWEILHVCNYMSRTKQLFVSCEVHPFILWNHGDCSCLFQQLYVHHIDIGHHSAEVVSEFKVLNSYVQRELDRKQLGCNIILCWMEAYKMSKSIKLRNNESWYTHLVFFNSSIVIELPHIKVVYNFVFSYLSALY